MSMSIEQRRTRVLDRVDLPGWSVRLTKACSRHDRRLRFFAVEILPADAIGTDLEEHHWRVVRDWPVLVGPKDPEAFFTATWLTVRAMASP